uniref:Chemokine (C-C motif) receptor 10 n=2 Tax=Tetraodon nigroviridis TaxID=99883 RepID=H3D2S8_TETNG
YCSLCFRIKIKNSKSRHVPFLCVFCVVFVLGVLGNGLVIATFASRCEGLRSMTDVFLLHLALADLLLLLTLPLQAVDTQLGWILPVSLCKATRACYAVNTYSGLLLLACISVDRYLMVARAQLRQWLRRWTFKAATLVALAVWASALTLSLPEILFSGVSGSGSKAYCGVLNSPEAKMATRVAIIAVFCLSFLVMLSSYSLIAMVLWGGQAQRRGKAWQRQRTLKLMLALVLLFLAFQLPYTLVLLRKLAGEFCGLLLEYVTCTLVSTRCCLNPILYALVGVRFRNDVLRLMHRAGCGCGGQARPQLSRSASPSSPAPTMLSFGT